MLQGPRFDYKGLDMEAEKPLNWAGMIDLRTYTFVQNDLEELATGFVEMPSMAPPASSRYPLARQILIQAEIIIKINHR